MAVIAKVPYTPHASNRNSIWLAAAICVVFVMLWAAGGGTAPAAVPLSAPVSTSTSNVDLVAPATLAHTRGGNAAAAPTCPAPEVCPICPPAPAPVQCPAPVTCPAPQACPAPAPVTCPAPAPCPAFPGAEVDTAPAEGGPFPPPPAFEGGSAGVAGYPARPGGPPTGGFFARIRDWGFAPHMILDVGANEGNWAREIWSYFGNIPGRANPTVIMFEGSQHRRQTLLGTGFPFMISVMGEKTRNVEFYDSPQHHTGNSVLRENNAHFAALAPTKTVMRTLDELIDSYTSSHPGTPAAGQRKILLKLDVQGYEINVLKGAKRLLQDVEVMLLETSVLQYNKGSPLTGEVLTYLESIGFQVLDVLELHHGGPSNMLLQIDFAFIKKGSPLIQSANLGAGIKE